MSNLYTVRFAHLKWKPKWKRGDVIKNGDIIGTMGNSGASSAAHLHLDCVDGLRLKTDGLYRMNEMFGPKKLVQPALDQAEWFIDDRLFRTEIEVTTFPHDPAYYKAWGWHHVGFDVVPKNRRISPGSHDRIFWNRSHEGVVHFSGTDPLGYDKGYGNILIVAFKVKG